MFVLYINIMPKNGMLFLLEFEENIISLPSPFHYLTKKHLFTTTINTTVKYHLPYST